MQEVGSSSVNDFTTKNIYFINIASSPPVLHGWTRVSKYNALDRIFPRNILHVIMSHRSLRR